MRSVPPTQARWRHGVVLLGVCGILAGRAEAQGLRGVLTEVPSGGRVAGSVVQLLAERDSVVASGSTSDVGRFTVLAGMPGTYRLRVLRIGHSPWVSDPILLGTGVRDTSIGVPPQMVQLDEIVVEATSACRARPAEDRRMVLLWDEARTGLAIAVADSSEDLEFRGVTVSRLIDPALIVRTEHRESSFGRGAWPIRSQSPDSLILFGFVQPGDTAAGPVYYGPDVPVFFSNAFLETHCFRLVSSPRGVPGLVGLGFEPAKRRGVPDIEGVLWIDRATGALRRLEYRHTGLWSWVPKRSVGRRVDFAQLPDGRPVMTGWLMRGPVAERDVTQPSLISEDEENRRYFGPGRISLFGFREEQGHVTDVRRATGAVIWRRAVEDSLPTGSPPFARSLW